MRLFLLRGIQGRHRRGGATGGRDAEQSARPPFGANTIVPSRFQVPPTPRPASHRVTGGPPVTSIFFSLPWAKKPMNRLSGDQNGNAPPSVPGSTCASTASNDRTARADRPAVLTPKATRWPSGESA